MSSRSNLARPFLEFPCQATVPILYMGAPSSFPIHAVRNVDYLAIDSVRYYAIGEVATLCQDSGISRLDPCPRPS